MKTASMGKGQFLTFQLEGETYAIEILRVKEIIEYTKVTKVPTMPPAVRGLINLRGAVVPVIDLGVLFNLKDRVVTKRTCIIIVELEPDDERMVMGVIADTVSRVEDFGDGQIDPPPAFGTRIRTEFLRGMGKLEKQFALILDVDRVLSAESLCGLRSTAPQDAPSDNENAQEPDAA